MRHKTILASILFFTISFVSVAQDVPPPMPPPPPGLPVDGTLFAMVLIVLGLYLGVRKILSSQKQ